MTPQNNSPKIQILRAQIARRIRMAYEDIENGKRVDALSAVSWVRTHVDELLHELGHGLLPGSEADDPDD